MKANSTQLEIIILTGTSFAAKQFSERGGETGQPQRTGREMLTEACWNGLLPEMFPEICEQLPADKKIFLWSIKDAESFIELELGEQEGGMERYFSIDPYAFIPEVPLS